MRSKEEHNMSSNKNVVHKKRSQLREIWIRLRRNKLAMAGLVVVGTIHGFPRSIRCAQG